MPRRNLIIVVGFLALIAVVAVGIAIAVSRWNRGSRRYRRHKM